MSTSSRAGEAVWERLWSQLTLSEGFWLGYVVGSNLELVGELKRRAEQILRRQARGMEVREYSEPGALANVIPWLLADHDPSLGLVWAVGATGEPRPWINAWAGVLNRLNEQRETLRSTLHGGLLLVGPPGLLPVARDEAPDLWSYRSLLLELPDPEPDREVRPLPALSPGAGPDAEDLRTFAERSMQPSVEPSEPVREALRAVTPAIRSGRGDQAVDHARGALDAATSESDRALAHAWLARGYDLRGDPAAALHHAERALGAGHPLGYSMTYVLLDIVARAVDPEGVARVLEQRLALARHRSEVSGDIAALREVAALLDKLGDERLRRGETDQAGALFGQALTIARHLYGRSAESPQALRNLSVSLTKVGEVALQKADLERAEEALGEALALARRLAERSGESPVALRALVACLSRVGELALRRGDVTRAAEAFGEALALARALLEPAGESPEALRVVSLLLKKMGAVALRRGEVEEAGEVFQAALRIDQRLLEQLGESPDTLRPVSESMTRAGDEALRRGEVEEAGRVFQEALRIDQRLLEQLGESPEALHDVSVSLGRVGEVALRRGDVAEAARTFNESLRLFRRLLELFGESPQGLRDLSSTLERVASVAVRRGDKDGAREALQEALALEERILERFGEPHASPESVDRIRAELDRGLID
jgi:tetratricopeptide (TPR) repeat protein